MSGQSRRNALEQRLHEKKITASFVILVIMSTFIVSLLAYQIQKTRNLAKENQNLIIEAAEVRKQLVTNFRLSERHLCEEIRILKGGFRKAAYRRFNDLDRNLDLYKITKTPEIVLAAEENLNTTLNRYKDVPCKIKE